MRNYGTLKFQGGKWVLQAEPHVILKAKGLFKKISKTATYGVVRISNSPDICKDLQWLCMRYPLEILSPRELEEGAHAYDQRQQNLEQILSPDYQPPTLELALPLRHYQLQAVGMVHTNGALLVCDDAGLGKTPTGIGVMSRPQNLPALVVCQSSLVHQWAKEQIPKFLPNAVVHIIKHRKPYNLPPADIYVCSYSKLSGWTDVFVAGIPDIKTVIYDEVQELRRSESAKWIAARALSDKIPYRCGLSATPIYNYGEEFFPVVTVISPGALGTYDEFRREWCVPRGTHHLIKDPRAFGSYLRENYLMLARTRKDVNRELPPLTKIVHTIDQDAVTMSAIKNDAFLLANTILNSSDFMEKGRAAREFDLKLRQATGISKAPAAAEFIKMLAVNNKVLVCAWHRGVYDILQESLVDLNPVCWTGDETPTQKQKSKEAFTQGDAKVMLMSSRSAAGIDGLQDVCQIIVFVELDWSDGIHQQCIWRLLRDRADGQENKVTAYFLVSENGSDPVIANIIGLKASQLEGIAGSQEVQEVSLEEQNTRVKQLAMDYIEQFGKTGRPQEEEAA